VPSQLSVYARLGQSSCHGSRLLSPNSHLVVSVYQEDIAWLADLDMPTTVFMHKQDHPTTPLHTASTVTSSDWEKSILKVRVANQKRLHPVKFVNITNVGDEASAYLRAMLHMYDQPPDAIAFVHGHRCSSHCTSDMYIILQSACLPAGGYLDLSPNDDRGWIDTTTCKHTSQTDDGIRKCGDHAGESDDDRQQPPRSLDIDAHVGFMSKARSLQSAVLIQTDADEARQHTKGPFSFCDDGQLQEDWSTLFANELGSLSRKFYIAGSAEFAISRSRLLAHPRSFYKSLLIAALSEGGKNNHMEYFWRAIFDAQR